MFEVIFIFEVIFTSEAAYIFEVVLIFEGIFIFEVVFIQGKQWTPNTKVDVVIGFPGEICFIQAEHALHMS